MNKTKIEWTETTWNPITGCSKISDGCLNCYAERMAKRLKAMGNIRYKNGFSITAHRDLFEKPLNYLKPRMIFVNSMSDLFHEDVSDEDIIRIFNTMNSASQHVFQVLTKRTKRLLEIRKRLNWTDNIWMGVSVEDSNNKFRIDDLEKIPSKIRFVSFEPLINDVGYVNLTKIDWAIVGGESGPKAKPMNIKWVLNIKEQCNINDTIFYFKQWGGTRKKNNGRLLEGMEYLEMPK